MDWKTGLAGALAGLANGIFGGGGGMVLAPALSWRGQLEDRQVFATSVAIIFPICIVSAAVYLLRTEFDYRAALPYLAGGLLGGLAGGRLYGRIPTTWLKGLFGAFLLYGGVKYLL